METLWSMSTTIREAERISGFLKTANELDGAEWNKDTQIIFQVLLIKNRQYLNDSENTQNFNKLDVDQIELLKDKSIQMTFEQAKGIFDTKQYQDPPMRGRQSMSPLVKLGLVYIIDKKICISDVGKKLANDEIDFGDFMLDSLLKFQYPNPFELGYRDWDTKPFINTLRLIKKVNQICKEWGMKEKGISKTEFGVFALSLKSYKDVDSTAEEIVEFRKTLESFNDSVQEENYISNFVDVYLEDFKNPHQNIKEYTDNMIRYLRLTKYIYIRGKFNYTYIDLEPRRMTEINSILENDIGVSKSFTKQAWIDYMGRYGSYVLPFETVAKLKEILIKIVEEINGLEVELNMPKTTAIIDYSIEELKEKIKEYREYRTKLQNLKIKLDYHSDINKLDEVVQALTDIRDRNKANLVKKYSIELEKWTNVALNIINDSLFIKPNAPVGDDNEPTYTAPNGVPDIECYYKNFRSICEVTMLTSRDQWYNEGQPVMRHLREFENKNKSLPNYCLFIAPSLHVDTINTFYMAVKYEYEGKSQKIVPITISQLISILETIKDMKRKDRVLKHTDIMELFDSCVELNNVPNSTTWSNYISEKIDEWKANIVAN